MYHAGIPVPSIHLRRAGVPSFFFCLPSPAQHLSLRVSLRQAVPVWSAGPGKTDERRRRRRSWTKIHRRVHLDCPPTHHPSPSNPITSLTVHNISHTKRGDRGGRVPAKPSQANTRTAALWLGIDTVIYKYLFRRRAKSADRPIARSQSSCRIFLFAQTK